MINILLKGIFKLIMFLVSALLLPIDTIITNNLPSLDNALSSISSFFNYIGDIIGYAVDSSGLSSEILSLLVAYYSFVILGTFSVSVVKLAIKWYDAIKP